MDKLTASLIGVSAAELWTLPICTVKTVYQSNDITFKDSIRKIYTKSGIFGFYKSSAPALGAQMFSSTYKLFLFNYLRERLDISKYKHMIVAGIFASITCILFTHPMDYMRIRIQAHKRINMKNMYHGFGPNMCKAILGGSLFLPLRQSLKNTFPETESWKIGALTAALSTTIVHPFDFFKTYIIGSRYDAKIPFRNPYRGLPLNLARIIPHFVIMTELTDKLMPIV